MWFLLLLLLIPIVQRHIKNRPTLIFSLGQRLSKAPKSFSGRFLRNMELMLRCLALILLVTALARPRTGRSITKQKSESLDIMLVLDTSPSMLAMDFSVGGKRIDRLKVSTMVLKEFIKNRPEDRLGLTVFGEHAFAWVPLTLDHEVLINYLNEAEAGMAGDSTAIGDALGVAVNRLRDLKSKSKIAILLTDGANMAGTLDPEDTARAAKALGVRVYTIGVGTDKPVPFPNQFGGYENKIFKLDDKLLASIANITDGKFFKADNSETLSKVYQTIDELEKTKSETKVYKLYDEKFALFLWPGLLLLILECFFNLSRWRRLP